VNYKRTKRRSILEGFLAAHPCGQDQKHLDCYFSDLFIRGNALRIRS